MAIDAKLVAELRKMTGAGIMDAKSALESSGGDLEAAAEELRKKGSAKAAKKADRETTEGRVHAYLHSNGKLGAMVKVACETDFVARNEGFIEFCNDIAMHISALEPLFVSRDDVPEEHVSKQKELFLEEMANETKPADILEKIVEGKLNKWFSEVVLLEQPYVKDEDLSVEEFVKARIATLGENIQIKAFSRFQIG